MLIYYDRIELTYSIKLYEPYKIKSKNKKSFNEFY